LSCDTLVADERCEVYTQSDMCVCTHVHKRGAGQAKVIKKLGQD